MRNSDRILLFCLGYCLLLAIGLAVTLRLLYRYDPGASAAIAAAGPGPAAAPAAGRSDSPGYRTPWYRVRMGLDGRFDRVDETRSIFRDVGLRYVRHQYMGFYRFAWANRRRFPPGRMLFFTYRLSAADSAAFPPDDWKSYIHVELSLRRADGSARDSSTYGKAIFAVRKAGHSGRDRITRYAWGDFAVNEWSDRGWTTSVSVPLRTFGGDSAAALRLADRMTDRIRAYYATLE
jgi:hypothetical protein